jgi:hypothetical protein
VESTLKKTHFYFKNVATAGEYAALGGRQVGKPLGEWTFLIGTGGYGGPRKSLGTKYCPGLGCTGKNGPRTGGTKPGNTTLLSIGRDETGTYEVCLCGGRAGSVHG